MSLKVVVCVNHFHPSIGGAEIVAKTIADYLAKYHEVSVFTRKLIDKERDSRDFSYPVYGYRTGDIVGFEAKIRDIKPDVVFVYSDVFDFFRTLSTKRQPYQIILALCGANWLYSHRNYLNMLYRNMKNIKAVVCHSKRERDYKICSTEFIKDKTVIIPNGIYLDEFDKNTKTRQELAPEIADKRWLVNVSNFFPGKGQEHLVDIFSQLPEIEQTVYIQISSDIDFDIGQMLEGRWKLATRRLKSQGMKKEDVELIPQAFSVVPFIEDQYVCSQVTSYGEMNFLAIQGWTKDKLQILSPKDYNSAILGDLLFCKKDYLEENKETVTKFLEASIKGWQFCIKRPDEASW
ncbi:hypothetical protein LCGC14_2220910, partial [marine sediment metagenome]